MSIEKLIHRKAEKYIEALRPRCRKCETPLVTAVEKNGICVHCEAGIPPVPKRGQPPKDGVAATGQIQLRVTMARKNAYVRAAKPKSLSAWMFANLDPIAKYEPTEQD